MTIDFSDELILAGLGLLAKTIPNRMNKTQYLIAYAVLLSISLVPLCIVTHPPLQDYPNHLARMHIINALSESQSLSRYYEISWTLLPNLAMDLVVPVLSLFMPLDLAGKLFIAITFFLLTSSSVVLHYAVHRHLSITAFLSFLFLYNLALHKGFLNFLFGSGLAVWAFALWILASNLNLRARIAIGSALSMMLFIMHLYALFLYGILTVSYELAAAFQKKDFRDLKIRLLVVASQLVFPLMLFISFSPTSQAKMSFEWASLYTKLIKYPGIVLGANFPWQDLDKTLSLVNSATVGLVIALLGIMAYRRALSLSSKIALPLLNAVLAYFVLPVALFSSAHADWRILVPLSFVATAAIWVTFRTRYDKLIFMGMIVLLLVVKVAAVGGLWSKGDAAYAEFEEVIAKVPEGSKVFPAVLEPPYSATIFPVSVLHIASFAVIEKSIFLPTLFATRTQQPIALKKEYQEIAEKTGESYYAEPDSILDWGYVIKNYDYVLIISPRSTGPSKIDDFASSHLALEASKGRFSLYRVAISSLSLDR